MSMGNGSGKSDKLLEKILAELQGLRTEVRDGFNGVNGRIDGVIQIVGGHHRDLEERVAAIEEHLGLKKT